MNRIIRFYASLQLREAIKQADAAHAAHGVRYFVIPSSIKERQLYVFNRQTFRAFKQKHYIRAQATVQNLVAESFYHTPCRGETDGLTPAWRRVKEANFYRWYDTAMDYRREQRRKLHGWQKFWALLCPWR